MMPENKRLELIERAAARAYAFAELSLDRLPGDPSSEDYAQQSAYHFTIAEGLKKVRIK